MLNSCLLTSTELILTPDCNLLHLHSNDMNSLKIVFLKKCSNCKYKNPQKFSVNHNDDFLICIKNRTI